MKKPLFSIILFIFVFAGCPSPPVDPPVADCPSGYRPCSDDSTVCCLDTTSRDFTWRVDTIGSYYTELWDVAIIDRDDIWVAGDIYMEEEDTIHHNPYTHYNLAHWNGINWEIIRAPIVHEQEHPDVTGVRVIKHIDNQLVLFGNGGAYAVGDGRNWDVQYVEYPDPRAGTIYQGYGTSLSNLFFVGHNGGITHYDGTSFQLQESGTTLPLMNVWGLGDEVWASGISIETATLGSVLLRYSDGTWLTDYSAASGLDSIGFIYDGYAISDTLYLATGKGLVKQSIISGESVFISASAIVDSHDPYAGIGRIEGRASNDLVILTGDKKMYHWNGASWKSLVDFREVFPDQPFFKRNFQIKEDVLVQVGYLIGHGIVFMGTR